MRAALRMPRCTYENTAGKRRLNSADLVKGHWSRARSRRHDAATTRIYVCLLPAGEVMFHITSQC